jgi:hypothetical protein
VMVCLIKFLRWPGCVVDCSIYFDLIEFPVNMTARPVFFPIYSRSSPGQFPFT